MEQRDRGPAGSHGSSSLRTCCGSKNKTRDGGLCFQLLQAHAIWVSWLFNHRAHSLFPSVHWIFPKHLSERGMKAFRSPPPPHGSLQKHLESIQRETDRVLKSWCGGTITERCREERNVTGFTPTTQPNTSTGGSAVDSQHDDFSERWRWRRNALLWGKPLCFRRLLNADPN